MRERERERERKRERERERERERVHKSYDTALRTFNQHSDLPVVRSQLSSRRSSALPPSAWPITVPCAVFITHPPIRSSCAFFCVYFRKKTPWTLPRTSKSNAPNLTAERSAPPAASVAVAEAQDPPGDRVVEVLFSRRQKGVEVGVEVLQVLLDDFGEVKAPPLGVRIVGSF